MSGETNLAQLLHSMRPVLDEKSYVFVTQDADLIPSSVEVIGSFREDEGVTLIVEQHHADAHHWSYQATWKRIIMTVHSSLEAVGFLATLSHALAEKGISVNAISAYYHDHLFVPDKRAHEAMSILEHLAKGSS